MNTRSDRQQAAEKVHLRRSRSSEILTYDPVRSGFLLPAALQLELFEQPVKNPERAVKLMRIAKKESATSSPDEVAWLIGWYRRQLGLKPREIELRLKFGLFLLDLGRTNEAVTVLQEILRMDPNHLAAREAQAQARSLGRGTPS